MSNTTKSWLILFLLACIWGSSFILMKKAMIASDGTPIFSDTQVGALRMTIAAAALIPFALKGIKKLKDFKTILFLAIVGFCGNFFPSFLFTYSETGISSGYAGMLNSCTPIFAILIGWTVFRNKLNSQQILGVIIGTVGVISLMIAGRNLSISGDWSHIIAVVIATFCYAISLNTIKHKLTEMKSVEIASLAFLIILLPSIIISLQQGSLTTIETNPYATEGLIYISVLSIVGTSFALIIFNRLIALSSVLFASSVTYLIPVIAVLIGIYFGENINVYQIISMLVVVSGIFIANRKVSKKAS